MNNAQSVWQGAPAVRLFASFALGVWFTVSYEPAGYVYILCAAFLPAGIVLKRWGLWPRGLHLSLVAVVLIGALITLGHIHLHNRWLRHLPEGDGVWTGTLVAYEATDGELAWRLRPDTWRGPRRPLVNLFESDYDEDSDIPWDVMSYGMHVQVTGTLRHHKPSGNPGEFNNQSYMLRQGVAGSIYVRHLEVTPDQKVPLGLRLRSFLFGHLYTTRQWVAETLATHASARASSILRGMLTGSRSALDDEVEDVFRRTGISHLLSVSGVHVGIMATLALYASRVIRLRSWQRTIAVTLCIWLFVILAGARPSAIRAGTTATLGYIAYTLRRAVDPLQFWALAGLSLLVLKPHLLYDIGFQLSFAASGTILLWVRSLPARNGNNRAWLRGVYISCGISLAAQLGTVVPVAFYFNELSLVGIPLNWVAVPLAGPILFLSASGILLHAIVPPLGSVLIRLAGAVVDTVFPLLFWISDKPWAAIEVAAPTPPTIVGWAMLVVGAPFSLLHGKGEERRLGLRLCLTALLLFSYAVWAPIIEGHRGVVHVTFIDVGQGDAILVRTPRRRSILIDGGGQPRRGDDDFYDIGERRLVPLLKHLGVRDVDLLINTHPDEDHLQGLLAVLRDRRVHMVADSGREVGSVSFEQYQNKLAELNIPYIAPKRGDTIELEPGIVLHILNPPFGNYGGDPNNDSVVIRMESPNGSLLLTGDLLKAGQQDLLWGSENVTVTADVIKVPHHGSGRDLDLRFIDAVAPSVAVIQVGRNAYGHPSPATVAAYAERGAKVLRNDLHGAVMVALTPHGIRIKTHR